MTTVANATAAAAGAPAGAKSKSEADSAVATSDFKSFLSLLTAQLKNQDPLAPLEATQFVEQLASFSTVEQQIETNRLLEKLLEGSEGAGLQEATAWIGKEVQAKTEKVQFSGEPMEFAIPPSAKGTASEVIVRNSANDIVYRETVAAGQTSFTWNGATSDGVAAPAGLYKISADYSSDGDIVESAPLHSVSRVIEARLTDTGFALVLENGGEIDPSSVSAVRETDI